MTPVPGTTLEWAGVNFRAPSVATYTCWPPGTSTSYIDKMSIVAIDLYIFCEGRLMDDDISDSILG